MEVSLSELDDWDALVISEQNTQKKGISLHHGHTAAASLLMSVTFYICEVELGLNSRKGNCREDLK